MDFCVELALAGGASGLGRAGLLAPVSVISGVSAVALDQTRQSVLSTILLGFARSAIRHAASCLPLRGIASRILDRLSRGPQDAAAAAALQAFLVSLLSDCADEAWLLRVARVAAGTDAVSILSATKAACSRPTLCVYAPEVADTEA